MAPKPSLFVFLWLLRIVVTSCHRISFHENKSIAAGRWSRHQLAQYLAQAVTSRLTLSPPWRVKWKIVYLTSLIFTFKPPFAAPIRPGTSLFIPETQEGKEYFPNGKSQFPCSHPVMQGMWPETDWSSTPPPCQGHQGPPAPRGMSPALSRQLMVAKLRLAWGVQLQPYTRTCVQRCRRGVSVCLVISSTHLLRILRGGGDTCFLNSWALKQFAVDCFALWLSGCSCQLTQGRCRWVGEIISSQDSHGGKMP